MTHRGLPLYFFITVFITCFIASNCVIGAQIEPVSIKWLGDEAPPATSGISWGVPWSRGTIQKDQTFNLTSSDGRTYPIQSRTSHIRNSN